jgi:hypothetical protein
VWCVALRRVMCVFLFVCPTYAMFESIVTRTGEYEVCTSELLQITQTLKLRRVEDLNTHAGTHAVDTRHHLTNCCSMAHLPPRPSLVTPRRAHSLSGGGGRLTFSSSGSRVI